MKTRYKKVYNSDQTLGEAFASRTLSPIGNVFRSPRGSCTHDVLTYGGGITVALWRGGHHFVTTYWSGHAGRTLVDTNYRAPFRIPRLSEHDTFEDMRDKLIKDGHRIFARAKRCRRWKLAEYDRAVRAFNRAAKLATDLNVALPTAAHLPEDFESWLVVETFKAKADATGGMHFSVYKPEALHPCYTSTLSPSCAAAA